MTAKFELSIMMGSRAISGSLATRFRNAVMAATESSMASSMLTSSTLAPPRTCSRATASAAAKSPALIKLANFLEPETLVRSPMRMKFDSGRTVSTSSPAKRKGCARFSGRRRGDTPFTVCAIARM
jgi:hypothetical protein